MLQQEKSEDYVIATGRKISVGKFFEIAAKEISWEGVKWAGEGID